MNKKKILILGGTGFIGSNLYNFFSKKDEYETVYCGSEINLTQAYQVNKLFEEQKPDIVLQYAAYTTNSKDVIEQPYLHATNNYIINALVLEAAHKVGVKHFIYPSCSTMYESSEYGVSESDWSLDRIPNVYRHVAYMKTSVERMCEAYSRMGNCKYTIVRQSNIFGPNDKTDPDRAHLVPSIISKVVKATDSIEVWGSPENQAKRDILYIDDLLDFIDKVIEKQETCYSIFNCGQGEAFSVSEIINLIKEIVGKEYLKLVYNTNKPNIPTTTILDCLKAYTVLGWYPKTSVKEGLEKTINWYKLNYAP